MADKSTPTDKLTGKLRRYESGDVTVTWSAERCIHFKACVRGLPEVFDVEQKPWIQPAEADAEQVEEIVLRCPTGALHFEKDGVNGESVPKETLISVAPDGPLYVHGDVIVSNSEGETLLEDTRVALCRCGASGHKPLCDGSHRDAGFEDSGALSAKQMQDTTASERLKVTVTRSGPLNVEGAFTLKSVGELSVYSGRKAALCRCGASQHKPFCDGSHKSAGVNLD